MFTGVRLGGTPYLPTSFRWGFGRPYLRGYKAITAEEKKIATGLKCSNIFCIVPSLTPTK